MPHFQKITDKLYQGGWPEIFSKGVEFDIALNVSDSPKESYNFPNAFHKEPFRVFVPINEWSVYPYEAFYATKRLLDANKDKVIAIHCDAGVQRSVVVTYAWLLSNNQEAVFPSGKEVWEQFLSNRGVSKAPPHLIDFLNMMNKYPTYSVGGIVSYLLHNGKEKYKSILAYLRGEGLSLS